MNINPEHESLAALFHALAHPIRYCIVEGLVETGRDVSTMVHCLDQPQPKISQHLNVLKAAGVIEGHREGARIVYSITDDRAKRIVEAIGATHLWDKMEAGV
ncbi:MAG: metalloregulator ArsR/SmtB family transcription factor [Chitinivibrionales bacterium]|nr:metalloregulator ArsR/SmtB family transcription factor [Chitinivibrionales bacterium]MBD3396340.1 metalloregulator ArsR/SmtB family transcription factor [Chitinivibrionales bacterium]